MTRQSFITLHSKTTSLFHKSYVIYTPLHNISTSLHMHSTFQFRFSIRSSVYMSSWSD